MAFQPFALDQYFKEMIDGGISQGKGREQWFDKKTNEATLDLARQADMMREKMKSAEGLFKGPLGIII